MEPERVEVIQEWPKPGSIHDIRVFIGFANYYRRFIRHFSKIAAPLNRLTEGVRSGTKSQKRNEAKPVHLSAEATQAFDELRQAFTTAPVLRHFDPVRPIRVETDASGYALSGILHQQHSVDGKMQWMPVAFFSRKMVAAERNYDTYDGELLAIVATFKHFRQYVEGAQHQVELISDHNNLQWFMTTKELSRRQVRWAEWLSAIDFKVTYRPGRENDGADALSRRPDYMDEGHSGRWTGANESGPALDILRQRLQPQDGPLRIAAATTRGRTT